MRNNKQQGFSLIELMITIMIISILATIAVPAYQDSVIKARRSDAQVTLLDLAQRFERCYTEANSYTHTSCPTGFPLQSKEGHYTISTSSLTANTYQLIATPLGSQSEDKQCMTLSLNQLASKSASGSGSDICWG